MLSTVTGLNSERKIAKSRVASSHDRRNQKNKMIITFEKKSSKCHRVIYYMPDIRDTFTES